VRGVLGCPARSSAGLVTMAERSRTAVLAVRSSNSLQLTEDVTEGQVASGC
jgi:hypothetical protein